MIKEINSMKQPTMIICIKSILNRTVRRNKDMILKSEMTSDREIKFTRMKDAAAVESTLKMLILKLVDLVKDAFFSSICDRYTI